MALFLVTWSIDIEADSPQEAAASALAIQRNSESWATFFVVTDCAGASVSVDLSSDWED